MLFAITSFRVPFLESSEPAENRPPRKLTRLFGSRELALAHLPSNDLAEIKEVDDLLAWLVAAEQNGATHVVEMHENATSPEPADICEQIAQLRASATINCDPSEWTVPIRKRPQKPS